MCVRRTNHSELERVHPYRGLYAETGPQSTANVVSFFWHIVCPLSLDIVGVGLEITERIFRRENRMRL